MSSSEDWIPEPELSLPKPRSVVRVRNGHPPKVVIMRIVTFSIVLGLSFVFYRPLTLLSAFGLIFVCGIYNYDCRKSKRILAVGDPVRGRVISVRPKITLFVWIHVSYHYQGEEVESDCKVYKPSRLRPEDFITLIVYPDNPRSAIIYQECGYRVA